MTSTATLNTLAPPHRAALGALLFRAVAEINTRWSGHGDFRVSVYRTGAVVVERARWLVGWRTVAAGVFERGRLRIVGTRDGADLTRDVFCVTVAGVIKGHLYDLVAAQEESVRATELVLENMRELTAAARAMLMEKP